VDRRGQRLTLLSWLVLGLQLGATVHIATTTWEQWRPSTWRAPTTDFVPHEKAPNMAFGALSRCQAQVEAAVEVPEWRRAEAACLNAASFLSESDEATKLLTEARRELQCAEAFARANEMAQLRLFEVAAEAVRRYDPRCQDATQARRLLLTALGEVERPATDRCLAAADKKNWPEALLQCARAMDQRCASMTARALEAPAGQTVSLWGKAAKNGWRPADPVHLALLRAEDKLQALEPWTCPGRPELLAQAALPDGYDTVRPRYRERFEDPHLALAVEQYHSGRLDEARAVLRQHVAFAGSTCDSLPEVNFVNAAIANAQLGYRSGLERLTDGNLEDAASHFRIALKSDEQVVLTEAERGLPSADKEPLLRASPTHVRASIQDSMHRRSLIRGNELAEKDDLEGACAAWKLGLSFGPHVELDDTVQVSCAAN
jgi:hypothetical protein